MSQLITLKQAALNKFTEACAVENRHLLGEASTDELEAAWDAYYTAGDAYDEEKQREKEQGE
jgi:hypothetical protein